MARRLWSWFRDASRQKYRKWDMLAGPGDYFDPESDWRQSFYKMTEMLMKEEGDG